MSWIKINKSNLNAAVSFNKKNNLDIFKKFIKDNNIISFKDGNSIIGTNITNFFKTGGEYGPNLQLLFPTYRSLSIF